MNKSNRSENLKNDIDRDKKDLIENTIKESTKDMAEGNKTVVNLFKDCNNTLSILQRYSANIHLKEYIKNAIYGGNLLEYRIFKGCEKLNLACESLRAFMTNYPAILAEVAVETIDLCRRGFLSEERISSVFVQGNYILSPIEVLVCRILNSNVTENVAYNLRDSVEIDEWVSSMVSVDKYPVYKLICNKLELSNNLADVVNKEKLDLNMEVLTIRLKYSFKVLKKNCLEDKKIIANCFNEYIREVTDFAKGTGNKELSRLCSEGINICYSTDIEELKEKILNIIQDVEKLKGSAVYN